MSKPIFTPSALSAYEECKFFYKTIFEDGLDLPTAIDPRPQLGTFVHVMQAAHELGNDPGQALEAEVKKAKMSSGYGAKEFVTLTQLRLEAAKIFQGGVVQDSRGKATRFVGYAAFRDTLRVDGFPLRTLDAEIRLVEDIGPIIAAPKLDLVLEVQSTGELWVAEHKVTERDDTNWQLRWKMDGQTTLQVLAAEKHYRKPIAGLLLLTILISRKQARDRQDKRSIVGRPLIRIVRAEPRWVPKNSVALRANYLAYLEDLADDYHQRSNGPWPASGMHTRRCDDCRMQGICSGSDSPRRLIKLPESDLQKLRKKTRRTT